MEYRNKKVILLVSRDREVREIFRMVDRKNTDVSVIYCRGIEEIPENIISHIVVIEENLYEEDNRAKGIPTVIITEKNSIGDSLKHLKNGIEFVLPKPLRYPSLCSVLHRYLCRFKDCTGTKIFHGIELNIKSQYVKINDCIVLLTRIEVAILHCLISEGGSAPLEKIRLAVEEATEKETSKTHMRVSISRLNNKTEESCGITLLENNYGKGYYITI